MEKSLKGNCDSCLMPFKKDPKGTGREHDSYCSYCYENGKLNYEGTDLNEFKQKMREAMAMRGENPLKSRLFAYMAGFAPRWKKSS